MGDGVVWGSGGEEAGVMGNGDEITTAGGYQTNRDIILKQNMK